MRYGGNLQQDTARGTTRNTNRRDPLSVKKKSGARGRTAEKPDKEGGRKKRMTSQNQMEVLPVERGRAKSHPLQNKNRRFLTSTKNLGRRKAVTGRHRKV